MVTQKWRPSVLRKVPDELQKRQSLSWGSLRRRLQHSVPHMPASSSRQLFDPKGIYEMVETGDPRFLMGRSILIGGVHEGLIYSAQDRGGSCGMAICFTHLI